MLIPSHVKVEYNPIDIKPFDRKEVLLVEFALLDERAEQKEYGRYFLECVASLCVGERFYVDGFAGTIFEAKAVKCKSLNEDKSWWQLRAKGAIPATSNSGVTANVIRSVIGKLHGCLPPFEERLVHIPRLEGVVDAYGWYD